MFGGPSRIEYTAVRVVVAAVVGVCVPFAALAGFPLRTAVTTGLGGAVGVSAVTDRSATDR